jgi:acetyl esterase/lipase
MAWSWIFLAVSLVGALFTWNAWRPRPAYASWLAVPSFFAGWLTSELIPHHLVWQAIATGGFVWLGALDAWPGWLGLGVTLASWAALVGMGQEAQRADGVLELALRRGLGADYEGAAAKLESSLRPARERRATRWNPFAFAHPDVRVVRDLAYGDAGHRHHLDVYLPRDGAKDAPVLLQIHGGAWMIGDKRQQGQPLLARLAASGWVCVAVNYRLSPKVAFPEHLIDVKRAIAWIRAHADEYGGDARFLAVTGGSAGGHLAALAALTAGDPAYQPGFEAADTSVQACAPFYGQYDFSNSLGLDASGSHLRFLESRVMQRKLAEDRAAFDRASPLACVHAEAPPFFVIHGTHDSLIPVAMARAFSERLRAVSRSPVCYAELPHAQHAFEVFHSTRTRHAVAAVDRFLAACWARWRSAQRGRDAA